MKDTIAGLVFAAVIIAVGVSGAGAFLAALGAYEAADRAQAVRTSMEETAAAVQPMLGPGYIENVEDITCADAGTTISPNCAGLSLSCECSADTYFGNDTVVPITGRAETNFDANVRSVKCRSQANTTCDCWSLCATQPN